MRQIDKFSELVKKMIEENSITEAQLYDAFHKSNPYSLKELILDKKSNDSKKIRQ